MSGLPNHPRDAIPSDTEAVATQVVDGALQVHRTLGPGLLERVYETCLAHELAERGLAVRRQVPVPVVYRGVRLDAELRLDLLVGECVAVELKTVDALAPIHTAQMLTYLRLTGCRLGLLINFNVALLRDGVKRIVF